jgi:hypothetical protein
MNQKESMCKQILESLFPEHKFEKVRLTEFKNPETNRSLELDLYNSDLHLALEYNGPQHYYEMPFYHRNDDAFEKQKTRDAIKEDYCRIYGITLIEVPNLQKFEDIKNYIVKTLDCMNISYTSIEMETVSTVKICSNCEEEKSLDDFPNDSSKDDGHRGDCRVCYNARVRNNRAQNKANENKIKKASENPQEKEGNMIKKTIKKDEDDEFRYLIVPELMRKLGHLDASDDDIINSFKRRVYEIDRKLKYPPTNIIEINAANILSQPDLPRKISLVKSNISLFLRTKRDLKNVEFTVKPDREYKQSGLIMVVLPKDIKLTREEISDIKGSLYQIMGDGELKSRFVIECEDIPIFQLSPGIRCEMKKILENFGMSVKLRSVHADPKTDSKLVISWPSEHGITENDVKIAKNDILEYIVSVI